MSEVYFGDIEQLKQYLMEKLDMDEDSAEDCLDDLEAREEESYKRSTRCSGFIKDDLKNVYYGISFTSDYDYGAIDFYLDTAPRKKTTKIVQQEVTEYVLA